MGSFKSGVTKQINDLRHQRGAQVWQRRYYDHIIRNEKSLNRIREYIRTNPQQWEWDNENAKCNGMDKFDRWLTEEGKHKIPEGTPSW